jgi:hypothetical protein
MRLLLLIILFSPLKAIAGEFYDRFKYQQVVQAGYQDHEWEKHKPKRVQSRVEIGFEKAFSCRLCPAYSIVINSEGDFVYQGIYKVPKVGVVTGTISKEKVSKILGYIETINYFSFRNRYSPRPRTHVSRNYTYVKLGMKSKVIENKMNVAPATIWGLELMLDSIVQQHVFLRNRREVMTYSFSVR